MTDSHSEDQLEKHARERVDKLREVFTPLTSRLTHEDEPAVVFVPVTESASR